VAALQQGRLENAANLIAQSLRVQENNAQAHYHLGLVMSRFGRFEEAAAHNRSAIALKPDFQDAHMNLSNSLKVLGYLEEAAKHVVAANPNLSAAHYNPFAAWRSVAELLRPGGVMMLGLYSKIASENVLPARAFVAENGFSSTPKGIRRARQAIMALAKGELATKVIEWCADFYTTSECRDLLLRAAQNVLSTPATAYRP
jgi:tetratricopeptide (TPR) repeat protein